MPLDLARIVALAVYTYLGAGLLFALALLPRRLLRVDPGLVGAPLAVRILLAPGTILLWPVLLYRWVLAPGRTGGRA